MTQNGSPGAPPQGGPNVWDFMSQMGFPQPREVMNELHQANQLLAQIAPDLRKLAAAADTIPELTRALSGVDPKDVKELTATLKDATATGKQVIGIMGAVGRATAPPGPGGAAPGVSG